MNLSTKIAARSLLAVTLVGYLYTIIRIARASMKANAEHKLDVKAIEATEREMLDRVADGQFHGKTLQDINREFFETLDFKKIAVREDI